MDPVKQEMMMQVHGLFFAALGGALFGALVFVLGAGEAAPTIGGHVPVVKASVMPAPARHH